MHIILNDGKTLATPQDWPEWAQGSLIASWVHLALDAEASGRPVPRWSEARHDGPKYAGGFRLAQ